MAQPDEERVLVTFELRGSELILGDEGFELADGTAGELIVPKRSLVPREWDSASDDSDVLPAGAVLRVRMRNPRRKEGLVRMSAHEVQGHEPFQAVEIQLVDALAMVPSVRGRKAKLNHARCWIPSLELKAGSINQAYTKISKAYQPNRLSNTGNVFREVFFKSTERGPDDDFPWLPLDVLRQNA